MRCTPTTDLELITRLNDACFKDRTPLVGDELTQSVWWVLRDGTTPVAFGGIRDLKDGRGYLSRAGVLPEHKGHGLQRRLINVRVAWARRRGLKRVYTHVWAGNLGSMRSLIRCGFMPYHLERSEGAGCSRQKFSWLYLDKRLTPRG